MSDVVVTGTPEGDEDLMLLLTDDLVRHIFQLLESPALLAIGALVCKRWRSLICDKLFFAQSPRNPAPLLGLVHVPGDLRPHQAIQKVDLPQVPPSLRRAPILYPSPPDVLSHADFDLNDLARYGRGRVCDSHNGGILVSKKTLMMVYYPVTKSSVILPKPEEFNSSSISHCLVEDTEDPSQFKVITLMQNGPTGTRLRAVSFDSRMPRWTYHGWADESIEIPPSASCYSRPMKSEGFIFWKYSTKSVLKLNLKTMIISVVPLPHTMNFKRFSIGQNTDGETCLLFLKGAASEEEEDKPREPDLQTWVLKDKEYPDLQPKWQLRDEVNIRTVLEKKAAQSGTLLAPRQVCHVSPRLVLLYFGGHGSKCKYYALDLQTMTLDSVIELSEEAYPLQMPWPPQLVLKKQSIKNFITCEASNPSTSPAIKNSLTNSVVVEKIQNMLRKGIRLWAPMLPFKKVVIDFRSPTILKRMGLGDMRSTILGAALGRMFEYSKVKVLRRNHVNQWATQFGLLIANVSDTFWEPDSFETNDRFQKLEDNSMIKHEVEVKADLMDIFEGLDQSKIRNMLKDSYKGAVEKYEYNSWFRCKVEAIKHDLLVQGGAYNTKLSMLCKFLGNEFDVISDLLYTEWDKESSFDNPDMKAFLSTLEAKGFIRKRKGQLIISIGGLLMGTAASDYKTASLAALWYRLKVEKVDWIITVADVEPCDYIDGVSEAAVIAGWIPDPKDNKFPRATHLGYVHLHREASPASDIVTVGTSVSEAKAYFKTKLTCTMLDWTNEQVDEYAYVVACASLIYNELQTNGLTSQLPSFEPFDDEGNNVLYLHLAYASVCSIIKNSSIQVEDKKMGFLSLEHPDERVIGLHLVAFSQAVKLSCINLSPGILCDYTYQLSKLFLKVFYPNCQVLGSCEEKSRLILCHAVEVVMKQCFELLGIAMLCDL